MHDLAIPRSAKNYYVLVALKTAMFALETGPVFEVPKLHADSHQIAELCRRAFLEALEEAEIEAEETGD